MKAKKTVRKNHAKKLNLTDLGCRRHNQRQVLLCGSEAELMKNILYNLPRDGDFHIYICNHGHTHRVCFEMWLPIRA